MMMSPKLLSFQQVSTFLGDLQIPETGRNIPMPVLGWHRTCPTRTVIWIYTPQSKSAFLNHDPVGINAIWCPIIFILHEVMSHLPVYIVQYWIVCHIFRNLLSVIISTSFSKCNGNVYAVVDDSSVWEWKLQTNIYLVWRDACGFILFQTIGNWWIVVFETLIYPFWYNLFSAWKF